MKLLQAKLAKYDAPQKAKAAGVYPYFRKIESEQDTEVLINGKKVLMFGSNSYLGLTNHPKVIAAAVAATKKYGTGCAGSRFLNGTLDIHIALEDRLAKFVEIKVLDATGVERRTAADYAVHVVSLVKQKFSQKRTVLTGDACDQCYFLLFSHSFFMMIF